MICYASAGSQPKNRRIVADGFRVLVTTLEAHRFRPGMPFALDNGAWTAFSKQVPFDRAAFRAAAAKLGTAADFVVAPDIVCGGPESLAVSRAWLPWCRLHCRRVLLAVQDGMEPSPDLLRGFDGVAIGGSTEWKRAQVRSRAWRTAVGDGWLHVLRVNTKGELAACRWAGVDSTDGSGAGIWDNHRANQARWLHAMNEQPPLLRLMGA